MWHCQRIRAVGFPIWGHTDPTGCEAGSVLPVGSAGCDQLEMCPLQHLVPVLLAPTHHHSAALWSLTLTFPFGLLLGQTIWQDWRIPASLCLPSSLYKPKLPSDCRKSQSVASAHPWLWLESRSLLTGGWWVFCSRYRLWPGLIPSVLGI